MFDRETLIDNGLLHTQYEEANQEYRHRNQLLHNTFYLLIIAIGVFLGLFFSSRISGNTRNLGLLMVVAGIVATLIGHLFLKHFHERKSAESVRMYIEQLANGKEEKAEKALLLRWGITGGGVHWDKENEYFVRRNSHIQFINEFPDYPLSAVTIGILLIYLGALLPIVGVYKLCTTITSDLVSLISGVILAFTIGIVYRILLEITRSQQDEPVM